MDFELIELIDKITELSPPILLWLALLGVGTFLKQSPIQHWLIPGVLIMLGAGVFPFIAEVGKVSYSVRSPNVFNAIIGAALGGFATGAHQAIKQARDFFAAKKRDGLPQGDTDFIKRSDDTKHPPKP